MVNLCTKQKWNHKWSAYTLVSSALCRPVSVLSNSTFSAVADCYLSSSGRRNKYDEKRLHTLTSVLLCKNFMKFLWRTDDSTKVKSLPTLRNILLINSSCSSLAIIRQLKVFKWQSKLQRWLIKKQDKVKCLYHVLCHPCLQSNRECQKQKSKVHHPYLHNISMGLLI